MGLDSRSQARRQHQDVQQKVGTGAGVLVAALVLGSIMLIFELYQDRPDYYEPVRSALVEARLHLNASYHGERDLRQQMLSIHQELETAIRFIDRAERTEPADRKELAALRERVRALEDDQKFEQMSAGELFHTYQALIEDINTLIQKHEHKSK